MHEYIDQASGKTGDRDQFKRLMAAASTRCMQVCNKTATNKLNPDTGEQIWRGSSSHTVYNFSVWHPPGRALRIVRAVF